MTRIDLISLWGVTVYHCRCLRRVVMVAVHFVTIIGFLNFPALGPYIDDEETAHFLFTCDGRSLKVNEPSDIDLNDAQGCRPR